MIRLIQPKSRVISSFFGGILDKSDKKSISSVIICPARPGLIEAVEELYSRDGDGGRVLRYALHTIPTRGKLNGIVLDGGIPSAINSDTGASRSTIVGVTKDLGEPVVRALQHDHMINESIIDQLYAIAELIDDAGMYLRDYLPEACTIVDNKVVLCDISSLMVGKAEKKTRYGIDFERRRNFIDVLFCAASIDRELQFNPVDKGDLDYFKDHLGLLKKDPNFKAILKPSIEALAGKAKFRAATASILKGTPTYDQLIMYSGPIYRVADIVWKIFSRNGRTAAMAELPTFRPFTGVGFIVSENYICNLVERITGLSFPKEPKEATGAEGKSRKVK
jgi:hypothetical protein